MRALVIGALVFASAGKLSGSPAFGQEVAPFVKIATASAGAEEPFRIVNEYWSDDGHWITEGFAAGNEFYVIVYEAIDGVLKEISREKKEPSVAASDRRRGPNPMKDAFDKWAPAVARIERFGGLGTGIILSTDGLILTNRHVVVNASNVVVSFYNIKDDQGDLQRFPGKVTAADKVRDLALVKVDDPPQGLKVFSLDGNVQVDPGDLLFAIGHPLGESWTPAQGEASGTRQGYEWDYRFTKNKADVIQFQTPTSPGSSGGPLINSAGSLVGINTFGKPGGENVNFAVHVSEIKKFVDNKDRYSPADVHDWQPVSFAKQTELGRMGIKNAQQCDFENDGVIDLMRLDSDNNGDWDRILMDINSDSEFEFVALDSDENGFFETLLLDTNSDGGPDYVFGDQPQFQIPVSVKHLKRSN